MNSKNNNRRFPEDPSNIPGVMKIHTLFRVVVFVMVSFISGSTMGQSADTLSLPDCLWRAGQKYPLQAKDSLQRDAHQLELENIRRAYFPQLNINAQAAYYSDVVSIDLPTTIPGLSFPHPARDQYSVALDVRQLIYDGGVTKTSALLETGKSDLKQQNTAVSIYRFKQQLARLFFSALFLDDHYLILNQNLQQINRTISEAQVAVDNGVLLKDELNVLLAARLDIRQEMEGNRHDHRAVLNILETYLDTTLTDAVVLTVPLPVPVTTEIQRPENKLFSLQRSVVDASIKMQQALRRPKLYGFGQAGYGRPGLNPLNENFNGYYLFGAKLTWTLWDWNQTSRKRKILSLQRSELVKEEDVFKEEVSTGLIRAREDIMKLDTLISLDQQRVELRKQISETYAHKFSQGTITSAVYEQQLTAYQQAQTQLNLHRIQKLEKQFDYMIINGNLTEYENKRHE